LRHALGGQLVGASRAEGIPKAYGWLYSNWRRVAAAVHRCGGKNFSEPLINSAIIAGEFPIGYTGGGAVIASHVSGSDLIAIASPLPVLTVDGWSRPEIKSVSDVRGKRVGVTRFGSSTYFAALSMLASGGIKPNEVVFIQNGGLGESFAALRSGQVDICMVGYPFGLYAKNAGFNLLFHPSQSEYGLFPTKSSRRGSRGSKTRGTVESQSTFYAR
jgi:ABC-type amino acid transport substrate-binding protein